MKKKAVSNVDQFTLFDSEQDALKKFDMTLGDWVNGGPSILFSINRPDGNGKIKILATHSQEEHDRQLDTGKEPVPIMPRELLEIIEAINVGKTEDEVKRENRYLKEARVAIARFLDMKIKSPELRMTARKFRIKKEAP